MNKFNADQEKWLRDLETTKEKQGRGYLNKDNKFCCFGRACEVLRTKKVVSPNDTVVRYGSNGDRAVLPQNVVKRLRLRCYCGSFFNGEAVGNHTTLTSLNDSGKWSFKRIAKLIRKKPWLVFNNFVKP